MTQCDRVRDMLASGWTCGTAFLGEYIPRYGARIFDLQRAGYMVEKRKCESHKHLSTQYEWRLASGGAGFCGRAASDLQVPPFTSGGEQPHRTPHEVIGSQAPLFAATTEPAERCREHATGPASLYRAWYSAENADGVLRRYSPSCWELFKAYKDAHKEAERE